MEKDGLVEELFVQGHAKVVGNSTEVVVGDGLPDDAAAHGEHLDVDFCALFNGVGQTKGDVKVRAGGKQTVLCPDGSLIGFHQLTGGHGNVCTAGHHPRADAHALREHHRALGGALPQGTGEIPVGQGQNVGQSDDIGGMAMVDDAVCAVRGRLADAVVHEVAGELGSGLCAAFQAPDDAPAVALVVDLHDADAMDGVRPHVAEELAGTGGDEILPIDEIFEVANSANQKSSKWIPDIAKVLDVSFGSFSFVMEYCQKNGIMDKAQEINDTINRLRAIQNNSIGVITLAEDLDIDSVTEIFIRINSKGVVLSQADFAMSKISSNEIYNGNVTRKTIDYFCHLLESPEDLKEIKKNDAEFAARPEFEAIKWAAAKNAPIYRTCYTDILRVAFTYKFKRGKLADLVSLLSGRDFETREFKIEIEERSFNQLHEAVLQAVNQTNYERYLMIVRSAGIVKKSLIRSQNVLNFGYALFLALRERKVDSNQIEKIVRKWLALSILTGRYSSGSPESAFDYDIKRFFAYDDPMQYLNITEAGELSEAYWKVNLVQRLNTSVASSPYFNMFLVAQVKAHDKGFLSMEIDIESMLENRGDIHHLFPKNYLIKNGIVQAQYNQIANYAFIQQEINIKIKDSSPAHYMTEVIGQCNTKKPVYGGIIEQDRLAENLKQNCIPDGFESMEIGDYQDFLQRRRELMAEKIHQYYDSL